MAKKKDKKQTINNIQELNLEIDYNKLAEAITRAQNQSSKTEIEQDYVNATLFGKKKNNYIALTLSQCLSVFFYIVCALDVFLTASITVKIFNYVYEMLINNQHSSVYSCVVSIGIVAMMLIISAFVFCISFNIAKEIKKEKDRNYTMSVFSGIVSFAALIVALVALFKGVG